VLQIVGADDFLAVNGENYVAHALDDGAAPDILIECRAAQSRRRRAAAARHIDDHQSFIDRQVEGPRDAHIDGKGRNAEPGARHIAFADEFGKDLLAMSTGTAKPIPTEPPPFGL